MTFARRIPVLVLLACACTDEEDILELVDGDLIADDDELALRSTATTGWTAGQERSLRYCVSDEFGAAKPKAVKTMIAAARHWESLAHVDFVYVPSQDATCLGGNAEVVFAVRPWTDPGGAAALPSASPANRMVLWNPDNFSVGSRGIWSESILEHELGHTLGLRHENLRPESGGAGMAACEGTGTWQALGAYDRYSLMQDPWCPASSAGTISQTVLDGMGARKLYGPPKIVVHAPVDRDFDGVLEIGQLADCDGDRFSDLLVAKSNELVCARSLADGTFASSTTDGQLYWFDSGFWGDFDGNGTLDYGTVRSDGWDQAFVRSVSGAGGGRFITSAWAFPTWAMTENAARIVGRFDTGAAQDVALVGVPTWATMPVMFGGPASVAPSIVNEGAGAFQVWAAQAGARIAPGDFDADGLTDIALVGGVGWGSVPIAFARGGGTWDVRNVAIVDFASWAALPEAVVHAGDFDGDGDSDLALTGPAGWTTIPIARSNRDGSFTVSNTAVTAFPTWASMFGATTVAADFDGNGCTDLATMGVSGWGSIPIALSQCNGGFTVYNPPVAEFPGFAAMGARPTIGYFDRDRRADIALVGLPDRTDVPIALSRGTWFEPVRPIVATFADAASRPLTATPP